MNRKKYYYLTIVIFLLFLSLSSPVFAKKKETVYYETKDEVIYGKLDYYGNVKDMYVVNSFQGTEQGYITDYGNYNEVRNLTNLETLEQKQDKITFFADGEDFYYQGEMHSMDIPWKISLKYFLDGEEISAEELAGKSGQLDIHLQTEANEKIDQTFFENYLLQITMTLDPLIFEDIHAPKGTEAKEGKNTLITFSVMPNQEETLITTAKAKNIELDPIEISAIPANIALDDLDTNEMKDEIETLSNAIKQIYEGVSELKTGVDELKNGTGELKDGSSKYANAMQKINSSSTQLVSGSKQILDVLTMIDSALEYSPEIPELDLEQIKELPEVLRGIAKGLIEFAEELKDFIDIIEQIDFIDIPEDELEEIIQALEEAGISSETIEALINIYELAKELPQILGDYPEKFQTFLLEMAENMQRSAKEIEENIKLLGHFDQLEQLQLGLKELANEYRTFHSGLTNYTKAIETLTAEYAHIDDGIKELKEGSKQLNHGIKDLHDGTKTLHEKTKDLPDELKSEIEKMLEEYDFSDFKPVSFISKKNKNIGVVQFVLKTEPIELEERDDESEEKKPKKSLWQRFLDLFRKK